MNSVCGGVACFGSGYVFVPAGHNESPNAAPQSSDNDVDWGTIGIIIAALAACGALALVLRRHLGVQRPLGA